MSISIKSTNLYLFVLVMVLINVFIKTLGIEGVSVNVNKIDYALILFSFILIFFNIKSSTEESIKILLAIFTTYTLISLMSSVNNFSGLVVGQLALNCKFIIILLICYYGNFNSRIIGRVEKIIFVVLIFNVFFIFLGKFAPGFYTSIFKGAVVDSIIQGTNIKRYSGMFYHPGPMGGFVTLCFLWSIAAWWSKDKRPIVIIMALLSLMSLLMSGQRMELAASILVLLSCYLIKISRSTFSFSFIGLSLLTGIIVLIYSDYIFGEVLSIHQQDLADATARHVLYLGGLELAYENFPFGNGLATFGSSMSIVNPDASYSLLGIDRLWWFEGDSYLTDTFWGMVIGESGFLGALTYLIMIGYLAYTSFKILKLKKDSFDFIPLYSFMSIVFTLLISFASPVYTGAALPLLIVGLVNAMTLRKYKQRSIK
jgi:hypothetical protein